MNYNQLKSEVQKLRAKMPKLTEWQAAQIVVGLEANYVAACGLFPHVSGRSFSNMANSWTGSRVENPIMPEDDLLG